MNAKGRRFISEKGNEGGSIRWYIEGKFKGKYFGIKSALILTDCARSVELDFNLYSSKDISQRVAKVDELIDELVNFKSHLANIKPRVKKNKKKEKINEEI